MSFDRDPVIAGLVTAATVLFLISVAPGMRQRRKARIAAVTAYALVLGGVLAWCVLWLAGIV